MKIKTWIATAALLVTGISLRADHTWNWGDRFHYDRDAKDTFAVNEFQVDAFATYSAQQNRLADVSANSLKHGKWGGGLGVNYFFTRNFGIGADTHIEDDHGRFIDNLAGHALVRFPIDNINLAPYLLAGGGRDFQINRWFTDAGFGLEFRLNRNTGIFADGRYVWVDDSPDYAMARTGLRFAF